MPTPMSVGGLISGLDTNSILDQLYQAAQSPVKRLQSRKDQLNQQSVAWATFEARLLSFRTYAAQLATPAGFRLYGASVSDPDLVGASVNANAVPGTYSFTVLALAQSHQLVTQGYADTDQAEVGSGTITIQVGAGDPVEIAVEGLTLAELRDVINNADAGVSATIVNDGSGGSPYRLILTSETSGISGEMEVTVDLSGGTTPTFSELQAAQDAQLRLGSGGGAITVTSSSNIVSGAIQGVTLNLLGADAEKQITLTLSRDTQAIQTRILDLVAAHNQMVDFFAEQFHYDQDTDQTGMLFGDYRLQTLQRDLASSIGNPVVGVIGEFASLSQLGIRVDADGKLSTDSTALSAGLQAALEDVISVFAATGRTTSSQVTFLSSTTYTRASLAAGWEVEITQVATRSRLTAGVAQADPLTADETLTINGVNISLTQAMTRSEVLAAVNAVSVQTGIAASATDANGQGAGNYLTLTRAAYGSAFHVTAVSTRSNQGGASSGIGMTEVSDESPVGESGGTGSTGVDVAGTIGGEACTGSGQRLTASEGDPKGLTLLVTATSPGSYGTVVFTVGTAETAFRVCLSATDTAGGTIAQARDYLADTMDDIDREIARLNALIEQEHERLRASFAAMESALAEFQSQSQFLASYVSQMQANSRQ